MKNWNLLLSIAVFAAAGCAERPAYFGSAARVTQENGAAYWEAPALSPAYAPARMRRAQRAPKTAPVVYDGVVTLRSISPAVLRSSFSVAEGGSAAIHFDMNAAGTAVRYEPPALDVTISCARAECRVTSTPAPIWDDGTVTLKKAKSKRRKDKRTASRRAAEDGAKRATAALRKDGECADLDQILTGARAGEETKPQLRARQRYLAEGCESWLGERGGAAEARRRVRLSQWTGIDGR